MQGRLADKHLITILDSPRCTSLYVQGWSAVILCMCAHMNIVSEKLILQGMSRLPLQGHPEPLKQKKIEAVQRMEHRL